MNRVVHFEIYADEPERAMKFYTDIFGWTFEKYDFGSTPYYGIHTGPKDTKEPGINGGLLKRPGPAPTPNIAVIGYACTIQVENIDETIKKIEAGGGTLALAKMAIPGMAWQAYYKDTEGNVFGVHQADPNAK